MSSRVWRDGQLIASDFELDALDRYLADPNVLVWFDLCEPTPELLDRLAGELNFSSHAVEDALAPQERPKAVWHGEHLFVQAYSVRLVDVPGFESRVRATRVSAFMVPNGLITVRTDDGFDVATLMRRWDEDPGLVRFGVGGLLHTLLDVIVDAHDEVTGQLDDGMEALEDLLFAEKPQTRQVSRRAYQLRRELVEVRRLVLPMRDVVNVVVRHGHAMGWDERLRYYFDDLYDHVQREAEWTESLRDLVGSIFETNLSLNDMRLNVVMKKLSGWAAIIAVPTLVTGWFGMNVPYLGFGQPLGLWLALGIVVVAVVVLYVMFKRYDWI